VRCRTFAHASELRQSRAPVALAGDFNVVPQPFDTSARR
jgi:exonuclease III